MPRRKYDWEKMEEEWLESKYVDLPSFFKDNYPHISKGVYFKGTSPVAKRKWIEKKNQIIEEERKKAEERVRKKKGEQIEQSLLECVDVCHSSIKLIKNTLYMNTKDKNNIKYYSIKEARNLNSLLDTITNKLYPLLKNEKGEASSTTKLLSDKSLVEELDIMDKIKKENEY